MENYISFATDIALHAGKIIRANFSLGMKKGWKADRTPLTVTDTTVNNLVLEEVGMKFPDHAILGEEKSDMNKSEYVWVCDPVDGTIPFSHGYPIFMFSLALTRFGESILGVLYDPILDRMFLAEKGKGAFLNGKQIRVSSDTGFRHNDKKVLVHLDADVRLRGLRNILLDRGVFAPVFHSATYGSSLVACGEFIGQVYEYDKPWDGAAAKIIVEEAGGRVTDLAGNEQRYDKAINGFIATNGLMHNELIELIKGLFSNHN